MSERRTLLVTERSVPSAERAGYVNELRSTKARCAEAGAQFWVFEHEHDTERYIEFVETKDASALDGLGLDTSVSSRWHAVELN